MAVAIAVFGSISNAITLHWVDVNNGTTGFSADEKISKGNTGIWPPNNIDALYLTWDADKLFIGTDFVIADASIDFWIETGQGSTVTVSNDLWAKKVGFAGGFHPDYAIHFYPSNGSFNIYKLVDDATPGTDYWSEFNGTYGGWIKVLNTSIGVQFNWAAMGGFHTGQQVKVALTLTGNFWSAGDAFPAVQLGPFGTSNNTIIDNVYIVKCDVNNDGQPDAGYVFSTQAPSAVTDWVMY